MRKLTALSLVALCGLSSCVEQQLPVYAPPSSGARMVISQSVEVGPSTNGSVRVTLSKYLGNCRQTFLGRIHEDGLQSGVVVPARADLVVSVAFLRKTLNSSAELVEERVFSTKPNAEYRLELIYGQSGYGVNVIENGKRLPFKRPCVY